MSVIGLLPLYKAGAKIGLKDFQVKPKAPKRQKFLQVSPSEVSFVFRVRVSQNYSHALCRAKNKPTPVFSGKKEERIVEKDINKIYKLFISNCIKKNQVHKQ